MHERRSLELSFENFDHEIQPLLPSNPERRRQLTRIVELALDLSTIQDSISKDPFLKNAAQRYFGLDSLKISALNLAHSLEADEERFLRLYVELTHHLILANVLRLRVVPQASKKFQTTFSPAEIAHYPVAKDMMDRLELDLISERQDLEDAVTHLKQEYELFLFEESSHEAARSFGSVSPNIKAHHSSWVAFAQFLTGLAVQVHESQSADLAKKSLRIEARREALFESCAELFAKASKAASDKDAKKIRRQLSANLAEIKKLETEIETTLSQLSVPGLHDYVSFIMKKNPERSTTFELNNLSQSTGDKT